MNFFDELKNYDSDVASACFDELQRQRGNIELIASENIVSKAVLLAAGGVLTNKYAEGYPGKRYYGGCQYVDVVEEIARNRAKTLFGAEHANVQPHCGASANLAVFFALLKPGDTVMGMNLQQGGHLSHGSPVNISGKYFNVVPYGVNDETERIDYDEMLKIAKECKPKLIVAGASAYSRDWDFERMRAIADQVGAILMADISHPAGLIARGLLNDPLDYCHIITTTTHKTLRGPRGGMILMREDFADPQGRTTPKGEVKMMSALINSAVFPGVQGGPLEHVIASKAVAFGEALSDEYMAYIQQVKKNASVMAQAFIDKGYYIISGGTDNHSMLIDLRSKFPEVTGKMVENTLVLADITVNKNMVPFDSRSPFLTSGLRIGTPAITTRGLKEDKMPMIVELIDDVISAIDPAVKTAPEAKINAVRAEVNKLMSDYPLFAW